MKLGNLQQKVAGVPMWAWGGAGVILGLAFIAFHRQGSSKKSGAATPDGSNHLVVMMSPQAVTPYPVPVTRVGGSNLSSPLPGTAVRPPGFVANPITWIKDEAHV